jgi:hypothetical protein
MPRRHISTSKESRIIPSISKRRAYVDFPDPAGPHMKTTRLTDGAYVASGVRTGLERRSTVPTKAMTWVGLGQVRCAC